MRILLNQVTTTDIDKFAFNSYPVGLMSIAEYAKQRLPGIEIRIVVGPLEPDDVTAFKPDLIGFSLLTGFFTIGCRIAATIRERFPAIPILFGGHHITYLPACLPRAADAAVLGEGEETFFDICRILQECGNLDKERLSAVRGIAYWLDNGLMVTPKKENFLDPASIPVLRCYDAVSFKAARPVSFHLMTSRGCPNKCRFCSSSPFWGRVRYYPISTVIEQIASIIDQYHPDLIRIFDDLLVVNRRHLTGIRDQVVARGFNRKVAFATWVAGNSFDDEIAALLGDMNCTYLSIAVESGSPHIYKYLKGKWNSPARTANAIRLAARRGFWVDVSVIVGSPQETVEDMETTYRYLAKLPVNAGMVALLKPLPGTKLWSEAKLRNLVNDSLEDWSAVETDDIRDPRCIFLAEKSTREEVATYLARIQKLLDAKAVRAKWMFRLSKLRSPKSVKGFLAKRFGLGARAQEIPQSRKR